MKQQNDYIFKKATFAVALSPAHEYELYSVDIRTHITSVGLNIVQFGTFLCPF